MIEPIFFAPVLHSLKPCHRPVIALQSTFDKLQGIFMFLLPEMHFLHSKREQTRKKPEKNFFI